MRPTLVALAVAALAGAAGPGAAQNPPASWEACEETLREKPDDRLSYMCFAALYRQAGEDLGRVTARIEAMRSIDPANPWPLVALGRVYQFRDSERAMRHFSEAVELAVARGDEAVEGWARFWHFGQLGLKLRLDEAEAEAQRALALAERAGDPLLLVNVRIELGTLVAYQRSEMARGRHILRQVELDPGFAGLPPQVRVHFLHKAGNLAADLRLYREAFDMARRGLELAEQHAILRKVPTMLALMADAAARGDLPELRGPDVVAAARRTLDLLPDSRSPTDEFRARWLLIAHGPEDEAEEHLKAMEERARRSPFGRHMLRPVLLERGRRMLESDADPGEALRQFEAALTEARRSGSPRVVADTLAALASARLRATPGPAALETAREALSAIETLGELQGGDLVGAHLFAGRSGIYYVVADHLLESDLDENLGAALAVSERLRARDLLRRLDHANGTRTEPGESEARRLEVLGEISALQLQLISGDADAPSDARARLERLEAEEARLREEQAREAAGLETPAPSRLEAMATALPEDEAIVSFLIAPPEQARSWAIVQTSSGLTAHDLGDGGEIDTAVRFWLRLVEQRDAGEARAAARVHERLLEPVLVHLPETVESLVVVPDGILHRVPFGALRAGESAPPMVERYRITATPSVGTWLRLRELRPETDAVRALVLADPEPVRADDLPSAWRDLSSLREAAGPLPHARTEGRRALDALGGRGELALGRDATEERVKQAGAGAYRLIHVAAHAVIDEDRPERSAILLSPGPAGEDGLLQVREIGDLELDGAIVVLSACHSAAGAVLAGEGVMGLARAFFQAGARAVVGGLWPLSDRETSELMGVFYRHLGRGETVDKALASAKRAMIARGEPTAAWAGLVALGAGNVATWPAAGGGRWRYAITIVVVMAAVALLLRRRRW